MVNPRNARKFPIGKWLAAALTLALLHAGAASATGLGRINVLSQMGQPFAAEIELINVSRDELATLQASLAPPAAYQAANLRFDPALNALRLSIERRANGTPYLRAASWRPVAEPYVDLLIDLTWAGGKLRRQYSALLDPPVVADAAQTTKPPVAGAPATTTEAAPAAVAKPAPKPAARPAPVARPADAPAAVRAPVVPAPAGKTAVAQLDPKPAEPPKAEPVKPKAEAAAPPAPVAAAKPEADKAEPPRPESKAPEAATAPPPAVEPAKKAAPPSARVTPPRRGVMDTVTDNLLPIAGGALALLAGIGGLWALRRRQSAPDERREPVAPTIKPKPVQAPSGTAAAVGAATASAAAVAAAPAAAPAAAAAPTVASVTDMVDPIEEAQVYLDHGRDEQAEEILRAAMAKQPGREDVQVKLLEILAARGDKDRFNQLAARLHKQTYGQGEHWKRVAALGYALDPTQPLYPPTGKAADLGVQREAAAEVDLDLSSPATGTDALNNTTVILLNQTGTGMDMDKTMVLPRGDLKPAPPQAPLATPLPDFNFELPTASTPAAEKPPTAPMPAPAEDRGLDFKIDLADINLNLDGKSAPAAPPLAETRDDQWEEVQRNLDLARAYQEMGDKEGALEALQEVERNGSAAQKAEARQMIEALK